MVLHRQLKRTGIAALQQRRLVLSPSLPDWTDSVDNVLGGQGKSGCDNGLAHGTSANRAAGRVQLLIPSSLKNCAADAASRRKAAVRRVDNSVYAHFYDVIPDNFKGHKSVLLCFSGSRIPLKSAYQNRFKAFFHLIFSRSSSGNPRDSSMATASPGVHQGESVPNITLSAP